MLVAGEDHPGGSASAPAYLGPRTFLGFGDMMIDGVSRGGGERRAAQSFEAVQPSGLAAVPSPEPAAPWRISVGGQDADLWAG
jgi:hypothetical protein